MQQPSALSKSPTGPIRIGFGEVGGNCGKAIEHTRDTTLSYCKEETNCSCTHVLREDETTRKRSLSSESLVVAAATHIFFVLSTTHVRSVGSANSLIREGWQRYPLEGKLEGKLEAEAA